MTPVIFVCFLNYEVFQTINFVHNSLGRSQICLLEWNCCFPLTIGITSPATLYDRYSSPTASSTRRRLFVENDSPSEGTPGRVPPQPLVSAVPVQNVSGEAVSVTPVPGQTLVTMATATVTANNGQTVTIPVQGKEGRGGCWVLSLWHLLGTYLIFGWDDDISQAFGKRRGLGQGETGNLCLENLVSANIFLLLFFFVTHCRYCQWKWRDNVLPSPSQCWGAGTSCDWLHPAPQCSSPGWKFELSTGDRNNLASPPWSGGHSTDFPRRTTAKARPTFDQQQY